MDGVVGFGLGWKSGSGAWPGAGGGRELETGKEWAPVLWVHFRARCTVYSFLTVAALESNMLFLPFAGSCSRALGCPGFLLIESPVNSPGAKKQVLDFSSGEGDRVRTKNRA